jgi:hypothetical protein
MLKLNAAPLLARQRNARWLAVPLRHRVRTARRAACAAARCAAINMHRAFKRTAFLPRRLLRRTSLRSAPRAATRAANGIARLRTLHIGAAAAAPGE